METPTIREARASDLAAIDRIYDHYVRTSTCTFQLEPAGIQARKAWFESHGERWPIIVAERAGEIVGWGSLSAYHLRAGYRFTVEDSVYVDESAHGQGIGQALLSELVSRAAKLGHHTVLAGVVADQVPSLRLHQKFGFAPVGQLREVGYKFDRWLDVIYLQKEL
jgi:L-amino acid N-acyltransferase